MKYNVGDIIRIPVHIGFRVWQITGVCLGSTGQESNYQMAPLDSKLGENVDGRFAENLVPCEMLDSHGGIECVKLI